MQRVLTIEGTVFLKFQLTLYIAPILAGGVISAVAFTALQRHQLDGALLCLCHILYRLLAMLRKSTP
jgi:hypothetical protein